MMKFFSVFFLILTTQAWSQRENGVSLADVQKKIDESLASKWYEKINFRGYAHIRYNRFAETNSKLKCSTCDKSLGDKQGFFIRRARIVLWGDVSENMSFYFQPDYATDATNQNYFQIRDIYFDYSLTHDKTWKIRTGLSKIPYGFANLQSSSTRASLDRDDGLNTATPNERDIGVFLLYTPALVQERFKDILDRQLKGSGNYGMISAGVYNGQGANKKEENNDLHHFARVTYPFKLKNGQYIETSLQAYSGKYFIEDSRRNFLDSRQAASFILYPQPIGLQVEYNIGQGPEYSRKEDRVLTQNLKGGYAQLNYLIFHESQRFFPYLRYQEYQGGRKSENGALSKVSEWEVGSEWQPNNAFELTAAYAISNRLFQSASDNRSKESGNLIRLQAQFNF